MQLTKCINNHFYDADKFTTCPHCGAAPDSRQANQGAPRPQPAPPQQPQGRPQQGGQRPPQGRPMQGGQRPMQRPPVNGNDSLTQPSRPPQKPAPRPNVQQPVTPPAQNQQPLGAAVDDAQKTVGLFVGKNNNATQPVVGWLVCIDGEHFGEDFRICMGRNFIGRSKNMDIVLSKDAHVSRDKHAVLVYEPKNNLYVIQAGESKELSYLNEEVVLSPKQLKPYDRIVLGSTKLVFVPFCNENFKWDEENKVDEEKK